MIEDKDEVAIELVIRNYQDMSAAGFQTPEKIRYRDLFQNVPEPTDVIERNSLPNTHQEHLTDFKVISKVEVLEDTLDPRIELIVEAIH